MSAHKPLEGVKVVELASFVAAPTAGRMMAEMGADVIRVESTAGDPWRFYGANCGLPITDEENPLFDIYNLGKKDIQLNTKTPEGKEILFHLLDEADVFITNNRLKSLVRSGLDYESLKDRFPKLIYGLVTGDRQARMWMHRDMTVLPFSQDPECWQIWQNPAAILQAPRAVSEMELQELRFLAVSVQRFLTGCVQEKAIL